MKSVLRVLGGLLALLLVVIGGLLVGARFSDGPIAIIAGGPFRSGELVSGPEPDWSFVRDVREVEFQLLDPARSRTTWILDHEGKAYIPCGYMTTWWGKIWKQWPLEAEKDPRILLRIGDELYERQLVRIQEGPSRGTPPGGAEPQVRWREGNPDGGGDIRLPLALRARTARIVGQGVSP